MLFIVVFTMLLVSKLCLWLYLLCFEHQSCDYHCIYKHFNKKVLFMFVFTMLLTSKLCLCFIYNISDHPGGPGQPGQAWTSRIRVSPNKKKNPGYGQFQDFFFNLFGKTIILGSRAQNGHD